MAQFGQEHEREWERGPDMGGEELVDGTGGGTENVSDVTRAGPDIGSKIVAVVIGILAIVILAIPVAWALGVLAAIGGFGASFSWLYAVLLVVIGLGAVWYAYWVMARIRAGGQ